MDEFRKVTVGKVAGTILVDKVEGEIKGLQLRKGGFTEIKATITGYLIMVYLWQAYPNAA